jgi:hypothetical protein
VIEARRLPVSSPRFASTDLDFQVKQRGIELVGNTQFENRSAAWGDGSVKGVSPVIISATSLPLTGPSVKP